MFLCCCWNNIIRIASEYIPPFWMFVINWFWVSFWMYVGSGSTLWESTWRGFVSNAIEQSGITMSPFGCHLRSTALAFPCCPFSKAPAHTRARPSRSSLRMIQTQILLLPEVTLSASKIDSNRNHFLLPKQPPPKKQICVDSVLGAKENMFCSFVISSRSPLLPAPAFLTYLKVSLLPPLDFDLFLFDSNILNDFWVFASGKQFHRIIVCLTKKVCFSETKMTLSFSCQLKKNRPIKWFHLSPPQRTTGFLLVDSVPPNSPPPPSSLRYCPCDNGLSISNSIDFVSFSLRCALLCQPTKNKWTKKESAATERVQQPQLRRSRRSHPCRHRRRQKWKTKGVKEGAPSDHHHRRRLSSVFCVFRFEMVENVAAAATVCCSIKKLENKETGLKNASKLQLISNLRKNSMETFYRYFWRLSSFWDQLYRSFPSNTIPVSGVLKGGASQNDYM